MLVHLMCAQARECLFEKAELGVAAAADCSSPEVVEECLSVGQEASHVSDVYGKVHAIMADEGQEDYVPFSWVALAQVKKEHCTTGTKHCCKSHSKSDPYFISETAFS